MIKIAPSLLSANFAELGSQIRLVEDAGAQLIHIDVMDGHFVPNITIGPPVVASLRKATSLPLDVHLMIEDPDAFIPAFAEAGANWISVHVEACRHLDRTLQLIQSLGVRRGVVLNPATPLSCLDEVLELVDYVLLMTVNPGFGGQKFIPYCLDKISRLKRMLHQNQRPIPIEVDGGVGLANVRAIVQSGAEVLVAGSEIFHAPDPAAMVQQLIAMASQQA
jgi:ribulose-phosphate 3-epimerase